MLGDASFTATGNVSSAPELRFTPAGQAVCNFSIAVQGRRKAPDGSWVDGGTSFYRCTVWRDFAANVAESVEVGQRVFVMGDLSIRDYTRPDGTKGSSVEVDVSECGPSLRFATAKVVKATRAGATPVAVPA